MGGSQPLFFMKKTSIFVFGRDNVYSSLHGISMVMIGLFFLKLFPQTPLQVGNVPTFRGVPAGRGILFRKKK